MDWSSVPWSSVVEAVREAEWSSEPRGLSEALALTRATVPRTGAKWGGRLKGNVYYYRTNYYLILVVVLVLWHVRRPVALTAVALVALGIACLNDSFALALSERLTRGVRRLSPPLAAKMRPPSSRSGSRGRPLKGPVHIGGQDRRLIVLLLLGGSCLIFYLSSTLLSLCIALFIAASLILFHATFRSPNLKARLNTSREEFRAVWKGYSDAP